MTRNIALGMYCIGFCAIVIGLIMWSNPVYDESGRHIPSKHESGGAGLAAGGAVLVFCGVLMVDNN